MTENQGCARGPVTHSQVHLHRNYSSCAVSSKKFSTRGERDQERDRRNHALHGPGVDMGGFYPPRLHSLWETPPQFSGLGVGGLVLWSSPPLPSQTQSWAETQTGPAVYSIHLLQCPLRQTRQTWDIWWIHQESEAFIQWASLAMWITSERRDQRPMGGQACQGEQSERWRAREKTSCL